MRPSSRLRPLAAAGALVLVAGCGAAAPAHSPTSRRAAATTAAPSSTVAPTSFRISRSPLTLPVPTSRPVVFPDGSQLLCAGGLSPDGSRSTTDVWRLDPGTGAVVRDGALASPVHDAAGAVLDGHPFVFGGGAASVSAEVQRLRPGRRGVLVGRLPEPRADLAAARAGHTAYLIGGFDGTRSQPGVLRTSDGIHFTTVATLPVPVRYPAVAALPGGIYLFGGEHDGTVTDAVQRIDLRTGRATVVAHLPTPRGHAAALVLDGTILVAGGKTRLAPHDTETAEVLAFDPAHDSFRRVGELPVRASDFGVAVVGGVGYLVGGENSSNLRSVTQLRPVAR